MERTNTTKNNLIDIRKKLRLSQAQMAEKMGFTDGSYIGKVERGEYNLSRTAIKLLEYIEKYELKE